MSSTPGEAAKPVSKPKRLGFFFSYGTSLRTWLEAGYLERYRRIFGIFSEYFGRFFLLTYGEGPDAEIVLHPNQEVLFRRTLPFVHALFGPILYASKLRSCDVLYVHQCSGAIPALISKLFFRRPLVLRCGYWWSKFVRMRGGGLLRFWLTRALEILAYKCSDMVIVTTAEQHRDASRWAREKRTAIIPNGVDTTIFKPMSGPKDYDVIFVGRLSRQKGVDLLIKACAKLGNLRLAIIGEGDLRQELESLAKSLNVCAHFIGRVENELIPSYLARSQIFVLPSLYEGSPKSLIEAMACGMPVIATDVEGNREVIADGENGLLCRPDVNSLKERIQMLLANEGLRQKLSKSARETAVSTYSIDSTTRKELQVLKEAISRHGA